jgi:protein tyrosine/serine phosphatase
MNRTDFSGATFGRRSVWWSMILLALQFVAGAGMARDRGLPPREGIPNFAKVDDRLYRGAQPDAAAMDNLQRLGVRSIISLRTAKEVWEREPVEAQARGMVYTNVPLNALHAPSDSQVEQLLTLLRTLPGPVFLHCQYGCDRTGTIVACYRIRQHRWSNADALAEAQKHGLSKLERGMRNYIKRFGRGQK